MKYDFTFDRIELHAVDHCNYACSNCNHASPFLAKKFYDVDDYIKWLDIIIENGYNFGVIAITGGEPFLLRDKINIFCSKIKKYNVYVQIFSNAFWIFEDNYLDKYAEALSSIQEIQLSLYPPFVEKYGLPSIKEREQEIRDCFGISVFNFCPDGTTRFGKLEFSSEPQHTEASDFCHVRSCTQLRTNGKIYRCPVGLYFGTEISTKEFEQSSDMIYNLETDLKTRNLNEWARKWPLDNCSFCSGIESRSSFVPWEQVTRKNKITPI
jgi:hypothetical protein